MQVTSSMTKKRVSVIAHNIRSTHNVGAIFRASDCFGVEKLYITGYTAAPPRKEITKVSLGTEEFVSWEQVADVTNLINELRAQGDVIASLEFGPAQHRYFNIFTQKNPLPLF